MDLKGDAYCNVRQVSDSDDLLSFQLGAFGCALGKALRGIKLGSEYHPIQPYSTLVSHTNLMNWPGH